jgi:uncharacterized protein YqjF (DUF2071 family)
MKQLPPGAVIASGNSALKKSKNHSISKSAILINPMSKIFLTAAWKNLVMANYEIDPAILQPYLPAFTELDEFNGKHYVSLVGFMFEDVKIKGISIPFHTHFPEVNLRFYVRHTDAAGVLKRGVVFMSEIVPKPAIAWVANLLYKEKYAATSMQYAVVASAGSLRFDYHWKWKGRRNLISAGVKDSKHPMISGSMEAFIFEHYYGFAKVNYAFTNQYTVEHPSWHIYPVETYTIDCGFEKLYGKDFSFLDKSQPASVFVAEGSVVAIREKVVISSPLLPSPPAPLHVV